MSVCRGVRKSIPGLRDFSLRSTRRNATLSPSPPPTKPKPLSPYRLLSPITFLSTFAPLHVAGWRLLHLNIPDQAISTSDTIHPEHGDLQDRRLVRIFGFEEYGDALILVYNIKTAIEAENHHPKILISPSVDYTPPSSDTNGPDGKYLVEISTHSHSPMPPQRGTKGNMRPGLTAKDIRLAERIETLYCEMDGLGK